MESSCSTMPEHMRFLDIMLREQCRGWQQPRHSLEGLPLVAAWPTAAEWTVQCKVNVLLAVYTYHKRWHIHDLLAHPAHSSA